MENWGVIRKLSDSSKPAKIRFIIPTIKALTASPRMTPTAADTRA